MELKQEISKGEEGKVKKMTVPQIVVYDPDGDIKDDLLFIKEVWSELQPFAKHNQTSVAKALIKGYAKQLRENKPKKIDLHRLFDIRE